MSIITIDTTFKLDPVAMAILKSSGQVLGFSAGAIATGLMGGSWSGGGNKPIVYIDNNGKVCCLSTGDTYLASIFVGAGKSPKDTVRKIREGKVTLKSPSDLLRIPEAKRFIRIGLSGDSVSITEHTKEQAITTVMPYWNSVQRLL